METLNSYLSIKIIKGFWIRTANVLCLEMSSYIAMLTIHDVSF